LGQISECRIRVVAEKKKARKKTQTGLSEGISQGCRCLIQKKANTLWGGFFEQTRGKPTNKNLKNPIENKDGGEHHRKKGKKKKWGVKVGAGKR